MWLVTCDGRCYVGTVWRDEPGTLPCFCITSHKIEIWPNKSQPPSTLQICNWDPTFSYQKKYYLESLKNIFLKTDQIVHVQLVEVISKVVCYSDSDY